MRCTDTLHADTTLNINNEQATVRSCSNPSAHSRFRSAFGFFAEQASLTGCEPNEQFADITSHNFASTQGDSGMCSISASSTCSVAEVAATTIPGAESFDDAPREISCNNKIADTDCLQERDWSSNEKHIARHIRRHYKHKGRSSSAAKPTLGHSLCSIKEMGKAITVLKHQYLRLIYAVERRVPRDGTRHFCQKGRVLQNPGAGDRNSS